MSTRELGVAPLSTLTTPPDEFIYLAHEVGFEFVGLRVIPVTPHEPQYDLSPGSKLHRKVTQALADTGLQVKDAEFILLNGTDQRTEWMTAFERAASLGARTLTVAVGITDIAQTAEIVAEMVEAGKEYGITPAIEPISYQGVNNLDQAKQLAATGSLILPDTLHLHRGGMSPQQLAEVTSHIPLIQICGAEAQRPATREGLVEESRGARLAPDEGANDVVGFVRALPREIPASVESPNDSFVNEHGARAWLEKLFRAGQAVIEAAEAADTANP
ncbi:sugar phosphate isomerase/epimerase family protein [Corynebacterium stationis]|uniref:sugar phosphate isomerase/epimerase family protein n=1 Tax=Corynebacterium stationis TaxID=1705 RepID=UPI0018D2FE80|nr:TIM barrel protein [Corynebacterium stationis]